MMRGHLGQYVIVIPEINAMVVRWAILKIPSQDMQVKAQQVILLQRIYITILMGG